MADKAFTGIVLSNSLWDDTTQYQFITNIQNQAIHYQGYFRSGDTGVTPHTWSPVYTSGWRGQVDCNLGDADWLDTATVPAGSSVVFVFWESLAGTDRTDPAVLFGRRGWYEIDIGGFDTYNVYPMLAQTLFTNTYSDDMPARYGTLNFEYNFSFSDVVRDTYLLEPFFWYNQMTGTSQYTDETITISHEPTIYGEQMFATVDSIRETLTFSDGDFTQRTQSPTTTNFTHEFVSFQRSRLVRTLEYEVGGVFYSDTLYPNTVRQTMIIHKYFIEYVIRNPAILDIDLYRDRDFKLKLLTDRVDFWTFKAQIRENFSSSTVLAEFNIDVDEVNEYVELSLDADTTRALIDDVSIGFNTNLTRETFVWGLKVVNPLNRTYTLIQGNCYVYRTVTRSTT
jgi:hypothetical protein